MREEQDESGRLTSWPSTLVVCCWGLGYENIYTCKARKHCFYISKGTKGSAGSVRASAVWDFLLAIHGLLVGNTWNVVWGL